MVNSVSILTFRKLRKDKIINQQEFDLVSHMLSIGNESITARELEMSSGWRSSTLVARIKGLLDKDYNGEMRNVKETGYKVPNLLFNESDTILIDTGKRKCKISEIDIAVRTIRVNISKQVRLF